MSRRIYFDGLNLSLERGTGIATYTRELAGLARDLDYEVGVVYSSAQRPAKSALLREIAFFDSREAAQARPPAQTLNTIADQLRLPFGVQPGAIDLTGAVVADQFRDRLPLQDRLFVARNLFANARRYFAWSGRFVDLAFDAPPNILHCTYQLPLRAKGACNVYTIHDLVPLRLPYTTLDNKRQTYRLLRKIAAEADHIVTVSEQSRRDIIQILGVEEERITNTYQSVVFPDDVRERSQSVLAGQLRTIFDLESGNYLLFFGALEPKKNVSRLIEAYLLAATDMPLVIAGPPGWGTDVDAQLRNYDQTAAGASPKKQNSGGGGRLRRFDYLGRAMLAVLIKGACAVLFPSLYEGFGLPVLEAMVLGTPVVTSRTSSLPEVGGDAALYVDPYDTEDIARAIKTIAADADLRAELVARGHRQAEKFSVARYRERIAALYERLA